jgi:formylmethanofuran dehydrogenase subunit E-like metal-binding protein
VLAYNFSAVDLPKWNGPSWGSMIYWDIALMPYEDNPEVFITVLKEFKVDAATLAQMQNAGMHPLKVAGVM